MELGSMKIPTGDHPEELEAARKHWLEVAEAAAAGQNDPALIQEVIECLERSGDWVLAAREKARLGRLRARKADGSGVPPLKLATPPTLPSVAAETAARTAKFAVAREQVIAALGANDLSAARAALAACDDDTVMLAKVELGRLELKARGGR
jgi:hypothetical protein